MLKSSFYGRHAELAMVDRLLRGHRIVSIVGPGGSGKSRLLSEVLDNAPGRLWRVELGNLTERDSVADAVCAVIAPSRILDDVCAAIGEQPALIALETCEHLLERCAGVISELTGRCPALRVLVTSREPLSVPGEVIVPVSGLPLPDSEAVSAEEARRSDAVRLFVDRAAAVDPGFELTEDNAAEVVRLCRQADGLPLAVEQAAGQVDARPDRHRDQHASVAWSYRLLSEPERAVLRGLSVLPREFGLDAALAACAGDGVLDLVSALEAKSLITCSAGTGGGPRLRQFGAVREFAAHLLEPDERGEVLDRLVSWVSEHAERVVRAAFVPAGAREWIEAHQGCVALAAMVAAAAGDSRRAVIDTLRGWWLASRGRWPEARALSGDSAYPLAQVTAGMIHGERGDLAEAQDAYEKAAGAADVAGDAAGAADCRLRLAWLAVEAGEVDRAERLVAAAGRPDEVSLAAKASCVRAAIALARNDLELARAGFLHSLDVVGKPAVQGLGVIAARTGSVRRAVVLLSGAKRMGPVTTAPWGSSHWDRLVAAAVSTATGRLRPNEVAAAKQHARRLTPDQLTDQARRDSAGPGAAGPLSEREYEIAEFVTAGWANREVAAILGISENTVGTHISNIFTKLGLSCRSQLATWVARLSAASA